jgi:SAM-dependent methyltransferase
MDALKKTADFWDRQDISRPMQFWDLPVVQQYRNRLVSGCEHTGYLEWFAKKYAVRTFSQGISLGCGSGLQEREAIRLKIVKKIAGFDIASGRLDQAKKLVRGMPIIYHGCNINAISLDENAFDFALCKTILHHLTKLEHVFSELKRALRPGSLLYINDYIGPARFQFPEKVLRIGDRLLAEIPPDLRRYRHDPRQIKTRINRIAPETIIAADPSEAIRSDEINGLLRQYFPVVEEHGTGGSILFRLLDGIAHNFDPQCHEHNQILKALCAFEENLIKKRLLPDIFKVYVLRNDK